MSNIIYAPKSWNPISGCSPVSEGCANCWAKAMARRQRQEWGTVHLHEKRLEQPLHWRKPRTVAVAFMGDLFHDQVPDDFIDKVFAVMALTPQHTYLLLTKRPERMRAYLSDPSRKTATSWEMDRVLTKWSGWGAGLIPPLTWPLPNVFLGVSCENQARADERIPLLLDTPAAHRWLSLEPLLGPVNLSAWLPFQCTNPLYHAPKAMRHPDQCYICEGTGMALHLNVGHSGLTCDPLDWVVIGGESGPHARPCDLDWIRDGRDQCKAAGTAFYMKQLGSVWAREQGGTWRFDSKGEYEPYWPLDLWVRETPEGAKA